MAAEGGAGARLKDVASKMGVMESTMVVKEVVKDCSSPGGWGLCDDRPLLVAGDPGFKSRP